MEEERNRSLPNVLFIRENDVPFEEDLLRQPYSAKGWLRYIGFKAETPSPLSLIYLYERGLLTIPGSYKLWKLYLDYRVGLSEPLGMERDWGALNELYERALVFHFKMPRIWLDYLGLSIKQGSITLTRKILHRALISLPVSQHDKIWDFVLNKWNIPCPETKSLILRRYLQFDPAYIEDFIEYCISMDKKEEAIHHYIFMLNSPKYHSSRQTSKLEIWKTLLELLSSTTLTLKDIPDYIKNKESIYNKPGLVGQAQSPSEIEVKYPWPVEAIFRHAMITQFKDQLGWIWTSLAAYFIRLANFSKARETYEEGLQHVTQVKDFSQIFDAFAKFEEALISKKLREIEKIKAKAKAKAKGKKDKKSIQEPVVHHEMEEPLTKEVDEALLRLETLIQNRPFLLNDVLLRQNPNNVLEWEKKLSLHSGKPEKIIELFTEALTTIVPKKASGNLLSKLWISFANFYLNELKDIHQTKLILEKAVQVQFKAVNELADVWIFYANLEKSQNGTLKALELLSKALKPYKNAMNVNFFDESEPPQHRLFKSIKLWSMVIELEKELDSLPRVRAAYDRILELKIATSEVIFEYAKYLESHHYFEEAFKVYEKGIDVFGYPIAFDIWNVYLVKFVERYQGKKLERARDLFEQALSNMPAKYVQPIFILYGNLEEKYGMARNAMKIYDRATKTVPEETKYEMYTFYMAKAIENYGIVATREIFDDAIQNLPLSRMKDMCTKYAKMEAKLGEIERARAIWAYGSQFSDPRTAPNYWNEWQAFEVLHGDEDTFREMLRVKRAVRAQYQSDLPFVSGGLVQQPSPAMPSSLPSIEKATVD